MTYDLLHSSVSVVHFVGRQLHEVIGLAALGCTCSWLLSTHWCCSSKSQRHARYCVKKCFGYVQLKVVVFPQHWPISCVCHMRCADAHGQYLGDLRDPMVSVGDDGKLCTVQGVTEPLSERGKTQKSP